MKLASAVVMIYYRTLGWTKVSRNGCGGSATQGPLRSGAAESRLYFGTGYSRMQVLPLFVRYEGA